MTGTLGFVTIGQAPRDDILPSMLDTSSLLRITQAGALDDLNRSQIDELRPRHGEHTLVSKIRTGEEVVLAKERLLPLLQRAVERVQAAGVDAITVLCTGHFPSLIADRPIIFPDVILRGCVDALLPTGVLGVLMPHDDQHEEMRAKWRLDGRRFTGATLSPYSSSREPERVARQLCQDGAHLIVMDCMGYDRDMRERVRRATGVPVVLSNRLVGTILEELASVRASRPVPLDH